MFAAVVGRVHNDVDDDTRVGVYLARHHPSDCR